MPYQLHCSPELPEELLLDDELELDELLDDELEEDELELLLELDELLEELELLLDDELELDELLLEPDELPPEQTGTTKLPLDVP